MSKRSVVLLAVVSALWAPAALAQISLVPLQITTSDGLSSYTFGASSCGGTLQATWTSTLRGVPCGDMAVWITNGECGDAPATGDHSLDSVTSALVLTVRTGTITINLAQTPTGDLTGFTSELDGGASCGQPDTEVDMKLCASIPLQSGVSCIQNHASPLDIVYDTKPPATPSIDTVTVKDASLQIGVTYSSDSEFVYVEAKGAGEADFGHSTQIVVADTSSGTISGLVNGTTYDLRAYAVDAAGNVSGYSDIVSATPLHTTGFWEAYRRAGGQAQGCSAVWGAPVLAGALLLLLRRRR